MLVRRENNALKLSILGKMAAVKGGGRAFGFADTERRPNRGLQRQQQSAARMPPTGCGAASAAHSTRDSGPFLEAPPRCRASGTIGHQDGAKQRRQGQS